MRYIYFSKKNKIWDKKTDSDKEENQVCLHFGGVLITTNM